MAPAERSFSDVLQSIIRNVQEIIRAEVRLAQIEIREEAAKAKSSATLIGIGSVMAMYGILFLLLTAVRALEMVMPQWAAALTVGAVLTFIAMIVLKIGRDRFRKIFPAAERTVETIKENVEWAKQRIG